LPALLLSELVLAVIFRRNGRLSYKLQAWWYFFNPLHWPNLMAMRIRTQRLRQVRDHHVIKTFSGRILFQEVDSLLVRVGNFGLNLYWQIIKLIIIW